MAGNNYAAGQNTTYPTAPTYPAASTYSAAQAYPSTPGYPATNAQYASNTYAPQARKQAPKKRNGVAITGFIMSLLAVIVLIITWIIYENLDSANSVGDWFDYITVMFILSLVLFLLVGVGLSLSIAGASVQGRTILGLVLGIIGAVLSAIVLIISVIFLIDFISWFYSNVVDPLEGLEDFLS